MTISDPSLPIQKAVHDALVESPAVAGGRVYDDVPVDAVFPYVVIGGVQVISEKAECLEGAEVYLTIDVWSRGVGKVELKQVSKAVIDKLDDAVIAATGLSVNSCLFEEAQYLDDPDGITKHGVLTFHILTD